MVFSLRYTCAVLEAIADHVRRLPGRKNLIWVTAGFPLDGKFHDLKVRVARNGGDVRARRGYIAGSEDSPSGDERESRIQAALNSALEASAISFTATLSDTLSLHIDVNDLALASQNNRLTGALDLVISVRGADGRDLGTWPQVVNLKNRREDVQAAKKSVHSSEAVVRAMRVCRTEALRRQVEACARN